MASPSPIPHSPGKYLLARGRAIGGRVVITDRRQLLAMRSAFRAAGFQPVDTADGAQAWLGAQAGRVVLVTGEAGRGPRSLSEPVYVGRYAPRRPGSCMWGDFAVGSPWSSAGAYLESV